MKKAFVILLCGLLLGTVSCDSNDVAQTEAPDTAEVTADKQTVTSEKTEKTLDLTDNSYINWYGRVKYQADKSVRFDNTASGFEVRFNGEKLIMKLSGTVYDNPDRCVYLSVELDGEQKTYALDKNTNTITLNTSSGGHTVKVLKRSEASMSIATLKEIKTDGEFLPAGARKELFIEFYGDSVTCGYGNEATAGEGFSTATENGLATYAYLTAEALNAECSVLSGSGLAVETNIWNSELKIPQLVNTYSTADSEEYPADKKPQIVVIYAGVNDHTYIYANEDMAQRAEKGKAFEEAYIRFLKSIRERYPEAKIFCCSNVYGEGSTTGAHIKQAIEDSKVTDIYYVTLPTNNSKYGMGADGHPNCKNHERVAETLVKKIKEVIGEQ